MRSLFVSLGFVLLTTGAAACGGSSKGVGTTGRGVSHSHNVTATAAAPTWAATELEVPNSREDGGDDTIIYRFGHAANSADRHAITTLLKRYYAAAAADDGSTACSLLVSSLAKAVPEEYAQSTGPSYLRGAKTCEAVTSRLFQHFHDELTGRTEETVVRLEGIEGLALLRSTTLKFAYTRVQREGRAWKVLELLGAKLP
jgi:hypothetical protein